MTGKLLSSNSPPFVLNKPTSRILYLLHRKSHCPKWPLSWTSSLPRFQKAAGHKGRFLLNQNIFLNLLPWLDNQDKQQCQPISFYFRKQDLPPPKNAGDEVSSQILYLMVFVKRVIFYRPYQKNMFSKFVQKKRILWINLCLECHKSNLPVQRGMFIGMEIVIYISCTKLHSKKWLNSKTKGWDSFC